MASRILLLMDRPDIPDDDDDVGGGGVRACPPAGLLRLGLLDLLLPLATPSLDFDFGIDDNVPISPGRGAGVRRPPRIPKSTEYSAVSKVVVLTLEAGDLLARLLARTSSTETLVADQPAAA
eukprot:CAMPEP_0178598940 /NCGR_PEP_ID=MMETSP0697-20121206/33035_1 /TAXON_ID=265572 /ORGANISM="Extubocellulus spinifer, Strain CCMP396" /LENGTH=121 /DNA_ID=CAMNT_0020236791 /DNA_START=507 /DNA_END=869 /DNA_ORIENTATION=+